MPKDIFDVSDVSDLPPELRPRMRAFGVWLRLLKEAGRPVTPTQVAVARFRSDGRSLDSAEASNALRRLVKVGHAIKLERGLYVHRDHYKPARQAAE